MKHYVSKLITIPLLGLLLISCKDKEEKIDVASISCSQDSLTISANGSATISAEIAPANANDTSYYWQIGDNTIISLDGETVSAKAVGSTWIYAISTARPEIKDSIYITVNAIPQKTISFTDENITYEGRIIIDGTSAQYLYPGSSISTNFTGTSLSAKFNKVVAYYWVEIDNMEPYKLYTRSAARYSQKDDAFVLAQGLAEGSHTAKITLCSEGIFKNPQFYGFLIDESASLSKPATKSVKFEFIGNSITCGYGTEVTNRSAFNDSTSNFCHGYAYLTAKEFNAETMVVARSGIGIYTNYGDQNSLYGMMPDNYFKTWLNASTNWDFTKFTPDVVFINLGTNDTWNFGFAVDKNKPDFDSAAYASTYRTFLNNIIANYPNSSFVLLTGSMMRDNALKMIKSILNDIQTEYNTTAHPFYRFDFTPTYGTGADWHPCAAQQANMGSDLINFLKTNNVVK